jgi:fused signal recognition particle receptor
LFESIKSAFKNFSQGLTTRGLSDEEIQEATERLLRALLKSDVPYDVARTLVGDIRSGLTDIKMRRLDRAEKYINDRVRQAIAQTLSSLRTKDFYSVVAKTVEAKDLCIIVFFGVNGSGKTTTIAKVAKRLEDKGFRVLMVAADTFRAGAIEQLKVHGERINIPVYYSKYGSDPASVAFAAIQEAKKLKCNVVLVDTAGRMNTDADLMAQMQKIVRVTKPDIRVFVGDALVGNDSLNQLTSFDRAVGIDGVILTKMDADAKGGIVFAVAGFKEKQIYFFGTGQDYDSLEEFNPEVILKKLF